MESQTRDGRTVDGKRSITTRNSASTCECISSILWSDGGKGVGGGGLPSLHDNGAFYSPPPV